MEDSEILRLLEQSFVDSDDGGESENEDEAENIIKRAESFLEEYGEDFEDRVEDILQRNDEHIERLQSDKERLDDPEPGPRLVSDSESDFEIHTAPQSTPTTSKRNKERLDDPEPEPRLVSDSESDFEIHTAPQSTPTTSKRNHGSGRHNSKQVNTKITQQAGSRNKNKTIVQNKVRKSKKNGKPKRATKKQRKEQQCKQKSGKNEADWRKPSKYEFVPKPWSPVGRDDNIEPIKTPLEYFQKFIDDDMIEEIRVQTNKYAFQKDQKETNYSVADIQMYLGVLIQMAIIGMPQYIMYWQTDTRYPTIADALSRNKFQQIKNHFHVVDNDKFNPDNVDKLFKVRYFVDHLRANMNKLTPEEHHSIDEQVIPFKGRTPILQYNKNKPHKWGYKVLTRAGASGVVYDFRLYEGASTQVTDYGLGISGNIVLELTETLPKGRHYKVYFDNWFSFIDLVSKMTENGFECVGTIRENRTKLCPLKTEKELKNSQGQKFSRGSHDFAVDANTGVIIVGWIDKKNVTFVSNYVGIDPIGNCQRWVKEQKCKIDIPRPAIVQEYNKFMGGVDLADMLIELYQIKIKSKRGYMRIIHWGINVSIVNGWLIYRQDCKKNGKTKHLTLIQFMAKISGSLLSVGQVASSSSKKRKAGRPSLDETPTPPPPPPAKRPRLIMPVAEIQYDVGHFPIVEKKRGRCKQCKDAKTGFSFFMCSKCKVHLCLNVHRNCFFDFHHN